MKEYTYKPEILVQMAYEYLYAADDNYAFQLETPETQKMKPEAYRALIMVKTEREYRLHDAFRAACDLVDADPVTVMATVKAMKRYTKKTYWQVCVHIPHNYDWIKHQNREETLRQFWAAK